MKIEKAIQSRIEYSALIHLYDKATQDSGDDPSDEIELAYLTLDKALDLLDLYRLNDELKEHYAVINGIIEKHKTLDKIREVSEEINIKEEELEEMK